MRLHSRFTLLWALLFFLPFTANSASCFLPYGGGSIFSRVTDGAVFPPAGAGTLRHRRESPRFSLATPLPLNQKIGCKFHLPADLPSNCVCVECSAPGSFEVQTGLLTKEHNSGGSGGRSAPGSVGGQAVQIRGHEGSTHSSGGGGAGLTGPRTSQGRRDPNSLVGSGRSA